MTKRVHHLAAASVLLLPLAACQSNGTATTATTDTAASGASTSAVSTATSAATSTSTSTTATSSTQASTTTSTTTSPTTSGSSSATTGSTSKAVAATRTILLNPKAADGSVAAGWTVENSSYNPCANSFDVAEASPFAKGTGVFTCGPNAANLLACWTFSSGKFGCIQGTQQLGRKLVMFPAKMRYTGAAEPNPAPMKVVLSDDTPCYTVGHDSANHWQGRNGWLYCTDGRMLLAKGQGTTSGYFDTSSPSWTAEAVPQQGTVAPTKVRIASATYAQGN